MNNLWKAKTRKQQVIASLIIFFAMMLISNTLEGLSDILYITLLIVSILLIAYVWLFKHEDFNTLRQENSVQKKNAKDKRIKELYGDPSAAVAEQSISPLANVKVQYYGGGLIEKEMAVNAIVTNDFLQYNGHRIAIEDITAANIETQSQISSRITATRLVVFGVFALAAPKQKKEVEKFLAVDYNNGFATTLILGGKDITKLHTALLTAKSNQNRRSRNK